MAQLVEHIVHIDGVTGSSPVQTTTEPLEKSRGFNLLSYCRGCDYRYFLDVFSGIEEKWSGLEVALSCFCGKLLERYFEVYLYFVTATDLHTIN